MKGSLPADFERSHSEYGSVAPALVDGIANWCEALRGSVSLQQALVSLVRGLGAEAGMIVRTYLNEFRTISVASWDGGGVRALRPLRMSFADGFFGAPMRMPRTASIWLGSAQADETGNDCHPALREWHVSRGLKEFVVLVLAGGPATRDHIELHYAHRLSPAVLLTLSALLPTMARVWASRQVGLITRTVVNHRLPIRPAQTSSIPVALLGSTNPARLSRAEFRVCLLLSRGLSVAGISAELSLSDATIRTHLRNIYAKTDTCSLAELVFLLLRPRNGLDQAEIRCA